MHSEHLQPYIRLYFKKSFECNKENIFHSGILGDKRIQNEDSNSIG